MRDDQHVTNTHFTETICWVHAFNLQWEGKILTEISGKKERKTLEN